MQIDPKDLTMIYGLLVCDILFKIYMLICFRPILAEPMLIINEWKFYHFILFHPVPNRMSTILFKVAHGDLEDYDKDPETLNF